MRILFINPPLCNLRKMSARSMPLGLLYMAAVLEQNHYQVKVIDAEALKLPWDALRQKIRLENPDVVGITSTSLSWPAMVETAKIAKEVLPNCKVIVGGFGPTIEPERTLNENKEIDLVCLGESEITIVELINAFEHNLPLNNINGLMFRGSQGLIKTEPRKPIMDLDTLPLPAHHLMEPSVEFYSGLKGVTPPSIVMFTSRGCPHRCIFCSLGSKVTRFRNPKKIVDEIGYYRNKFKIKTIIIYDDEFIGMSIQQNQWILEICDEIIKRGYNDLFYAVEGRCSKFIDLEVLKRMKQANFRWIWWGVESGSQRVLDSIKKDIAVENIERTFSLAQQAGLESLMFIMTGFPEETEEDVKKTADLIARIKPAIVRIHVATPMPGSELHRILKEQNLIDEFNILKYDTRGYPVHHTKHFSREEIFRNQKMLKLRFEGSKKKFIKLIFYYLFTVDGFKKLPSRLKKAINYGWYWIYWTIKYRK